ncbi:MAG: DNA-directed RNA polymerase subunit H [Euryarchaeota archaeon]|jgi:DNA-directed RNA polymerase subunit H (RpoH/RPB5)|nr:DNA-directed RNA polymerase subunit H [Euryarchaeota archaeon]
MRFNVLNHELVPLHELVPSEGEMEELEPWDLVGTDIDGSPRLRIELLPKILITDPAIQALKEAMENKDDELRAGWLNNRVIRVTRRSPSAGIHVAYRLVVEGN